MESFVDGDLAANNGGWQWVASVSFELRNDQRTKLIPSDWN